MVAKSNESPQQTASGEALPVIDGKLSPREHAVASGQIRRALTTFNGVTELRLPDYRAASALHGWDAHASHSAEPMRITREAFDAAIEATKTADARGSYAPHIEALAPHLKKVETK